MMARENLSVPEESLAEVIEVIRAGLEVAVEVSEDTRRNLLRWCDEEQEYLVRWCDEEQDGDER